MSDYLYIQYRSAQRQNDLNCVWQVVKAFCLSTNKIYDWCFKPRFCICKAIPGREQTRQISTNMIKFFGTVWDTETTHCYWGLTLRYYNIISGNDKCTSNWLQSIASNSIKHAATELPSYHCVCVCVCVCVFVCLFVCVRVCVCVCVFVR